MGDWIVIGVSLLGGVAVGSGIGVAVGSGVGVAVGSGVDVAVGSDVGVTVGSSVGITVAVGIEVLVFASSFVPQATIHIIIIVLIITTIIFFISTFPPFVIAYQYLLLIPLPAPLNQPVSSVPAPYAEYRFPMLL